MLKFYMVKTSKFPILHPFDRLPHFQTGLPSRSLSLQMPEGIAKIFTSEIPELSPADAARFKQLMAARTPPRDERFPSTNQAMRCWNLYNEWVLCATQQDEEKCKSMRYASESICPSHWVEQFDEARDEGTFTGIGSRFISKGH